jgi:hypothetical protein
VRGLYSGLTAQLLRAWTYAPARCGQPPSPYRRRVAAPHLPNLKFTGLTQNLGQL